jgi:hypothetical protein
VQLCDSAHTAVCATFIYANKDITDPYKMETMLEDEE